MNHTIPKGLIHVDDTQPGIKRRRWGRGFSYIDCEGKRISDQACLQRIRELRIPPAWEAVWICSLPHGHLQATGRDFKNRKQYLYHPEWTAYSQRTKFDHLLEFAGRLPEIRQRYEKDLRRKEWDQRKVLALAVALMDELYLRIGNEYYRSHNKTYGLTTLRRKHLDFEENKVYFHFQGKKQKQRNLELSNRKLTRLLQQCSELPGYELFRYEGEQGYHPIDSADFNAYLNEGLDENVYLTAKDFRTWGGCVLCVHYEPEARAICEANPRKKKETALIELVAKALGNTVSVCRKYYIHPKVLTYCTEHSNLQARKSTLKKFPEYDEDEQIVLEILGL